jgi:putative Mn2+ efflux pump MntP
VAVFAAVMLLTGWLLAKFEPQLIISVSGILVGLGYSPPNRLSAALSYPAACRSGQALDGGLPSTVKRFIGGCVLLLCGTAMVRHTIVNKPRAMKEYQGRAVSQEADQNFFAFASIVAVLFVTAIWNSP